MKHRLIGVVAIVCGLAACADGEPEDLFCGSLAAYDVPGADAQGINFQGIDLQGVKMQGVFMQGIDLQGIKFQGISFQGVKMQGVKMQGVKMQGVEMQGVEMQGIALQGTELVAYARDGAEFAGAELVGLSLSGVLSDGSTIALTIVEASQRDGLWYYRMGHNGEDLCAAPGGGLLVPGAWDEAGGYHSELTVGDHTIQLSYACPSGVIAKCVTWGYDGGSANHQACTRMARADYCGDGTAYTQEGTAIDMRDIDGIQVPDNAAGFVFEAGWSPDGARCVHHPRYQHLVNGQAVMPSCWDQLPACASWTDATEQGAILGNASIQSTQHHNCPP